MTSDPLAAYAEPLEARVEDGEIILIGPRNMCGAFLPIAAEKSALNIIEALEILRTQSNKLR